MKKYLILALLLCFSAGAAMAGTETRTYGLDPTSGWGYSSKLTGKIGVTFTGNYGELELTDKIVREHDENYNWSTIENGGLDVSEYTGALIVCSEVDNVQLKVEYENMVGVGDIDHYIGLSTGTNELTFLTDHGNVTLLALQDNGSGATTPSSCIIEEAYLIKAAEEGGEATEEAMVYTGDYGSWGYSCVAYSPEISYSQQNAEIHLANADGTVFSLKQGSEDTYTFTITLAEDAPIDILVKTVFESGNDGYPGSISKGGATLSFTIDASSVSERSLSYIALMANTEDVDGEDSNYPATVKFASITATVTGDDITGDFDPTFPLPSVVNPGATHPIGGACFGETTDDTGETTKTTYNDETHTVTYGAAYGGCGWWLGGYNDEDTGEHTNTEDYSSYQGIEVAFKADTDDYIQLVVEYYRSESEEGKESPDLVTSAAYTIGTPGSGQTLYVSFNESYSEHMYQIYLQGGTTVGGKITILGARLIPKSDDNEEYTYKVNLAGYATSNWDTTGEDKIVVNELDGADFLGTADLTFHASYDGDDTVGLGWHNWGNTGDGAFNLAQFDEVRISYEVTSQDSDDDNVTVQALFNNTNYEEEGTNVNILQKDSNSDGVITLTIAAGSYSDDNGTQIDDFDWTHVGQIVLQASAACTVKITSIEFWRNVRTAPDVQNIDLSTSEGNTIISRTGGTIKVSGDGSSGNTFSFPLNATGTYDIYIASDTKIDTSVGESNLNAGITIPRGVTVNLYIDGEVSLTGDTYGIYVNYDSELNIYYPVDETEETTQELDITADYGIYFLGSNFGIWGGSEYGDSPNYQNGLTNITAKYCGIYVGKETRYAEIKGNDVTITVTGNAGDLDENSPIDGISGIYNAVEGSLQFNFSVMNLTITAEGEDTYGIFSNISSGNGVYFGFGTYKITATKCVIHRVTRYAGGLIYTSPDSNWEESGNVITIELIGPFCIHKEEWYQWDGSYGGADWWTCDGAYGYTTDENDLGEASGDSELPSSAVYPVNDENDYHSVEATIKNVYELEYYNRTLYKGWNTLSLPCEYDLTGDDDDTTYDGYEARNVITKVATYDSINEVDSDEDSETVTEDGDKIKYAYMLNFNYLPEGTTKLDADTPYLVYVENTVVEDVNTDEWKILVHFTSKDKDVKKVHDDQGDGLKTVFQKETLTHEGTISGDENEDDTYYYKLYNPSQDEKTGEAYFNRPEEGYTAKVGAFRAYLSLEELIEKGATVQALSIRFDDGTTTSIEELDGGVNAENGRVHVYGVDGKLVKISDAGEATKGLSRGVYVIDGKKVVVM